MAWPPSLGQERSVHPARVMITATGRSHDENQANRRGGYQEADMTERDANRSRPDDAGGMARDRGAPDQATVQPPAPPQAARRARPAGQREDDERDERDERETGGRDTGGAGQAGGGV